MAIFILALASELDCKICHTVLKGGYMKILLSFSLFLAMTAASSNANAGCKTHYDYNSVFGSSRIVKSMLEAKGYEIAADGDSIDLDYSIYLDNYIKNGECKMVVTVGYMNKEGDASLLDFYKQAAPTKALIFCPHRQMLKQIVDELPNCGEAN